MKNWLNFALILGAIYVVYEYWYLPSQALQQANPGVTLPPNATAPTSQVQPLSAALAAKAGVGSLMTLSPAQWAGYLGQLVLQAPPNATQLAAAFPGVTAVTASAFVAGLIAAGLTPQVEGAYGLSGIRRIA